MHSSPIICAISTPPGSGGVAVVRITGKGSIELADTLFFSPKGKKLAKCLAYTLHFGEIRRKTGEAIDEVLAAVFRAPHSYTGEDTVEITCHGSTYIQQQILQALIESGARLAQPGEFTQLAFLNGKMDLSQAEAVADLIASTSAGQHKLALGQMRGGFSLELIRLRSQLLDFTSLIELELDFSEEEVEFANRAHLTTLATDIERVISRLADSFQVGNAIKNGIPVAIIGETNAGKSTLLNLLVGEERAIVSDIHGTTRDVIEDTINLGGITFRFIDTAGIRDTADTIESLGIERTFRQLEQASIVLWVIDIASPSDQIEELAARILPKTEGKHLILVFNKCDLLTAEELAARQHHLPGTDTSRFDAPPRNTPSAGIGSESSTTRRLYISAKQRHNTDSLQSEILRAAALPEVSPSDIIVTNLRHYEALTHARTAILRVIDGLDARISGDFLSQDIRECLHYLGEITGHITTDEVLGNIFSRFCIGK